MRPINYFKRFVICPVEIEDVQLRERRLFQRENEKMNNTDGNYGLSSICASLVLVVLYGSYTHGGLASQGRLAVPLDRAVLPVED